jgi:hypothetical protein
MAGAQELREGLEDETNKLKFLSLEEAMIRL